MKIAWCTPYDESSAIGRFSRVVFNELSKKHKVDVWAPSSDTPQIKGEKAKPLSSHPSTLAALRAYDLVIYNLGDNFLRHLEIYECSQHVPGVVILHDFVMHNFFHAYYFNHLRNPELYLNEVDFLYGQGAMKAAREALDNRALPLWDTQNVINYPFFEKALTGALGVVVHARFLEAAVEKVFSGPMKQIPLAYPLPVDGTAERGDEKLLADIRTFVGQRKMLLTVGHLNPNKRLHKVLRALKQDPQLASSVALVVIGQMAENGYEKELAALMEDEALKSCVWFLGRKSQYILHRCLELCDLCINLRVPAMEGASASVLEQLLMSKPVVVSNTGCYAELPDDCVIKINPDAEEEPLKLILRDLTKSPKRFAEAGERGRRFALEHHTGSAYVDSLLPFLETVTKFKPFANCHSNLASELRFLSAFRHMKSLSVIQKEANAISPSEFQLSEKVLGLQLNETMTSDYQPPKTMAEALQQPFEDFVRGIYKSILRRDVDPEGLKANVAYLLRGGNPISLAASIANSDEAKLLGIHLSGTLSTSTELSYLSMAQTLTGSFTRKLKCRLKKVRDAYRRMKRR